MLVPLPTCLIVCLSSLCLFDCLPLSFTPRALIKRARNLITWWEPHLFPLSEIRVCLCVVLIKYILSLACLTDLYLRRGALLFYLEPSHLRFIRCCSLQLSVSGWRHQSLSPFFKRCKLSLLTVDKVNIFCCFHWLQHLNIAIIKTGKYSTTYLQMYTRMGNNGWSH